MSQVILSEFISLTIDEILKGVKDSKVSSMQKYKNTIIAPGFINGKEVDSETFIEFEILTETSKESDGKLKISVISGSVGSSSKEFQRIKFSVPVLFRGLK